MKKVGKKLRSSKGFTLAEVLAAVVVLAVLCVALGSGVSATVNVYAKMTDSAEASVLINTLTVAVSDELHYATEISAAGYTSAVYGPGIRLITTDDGRIAAEKTPAGGGTAAVYYLVSDKTYTSGLSAEISVAYGAVSTVSLEILDKDGTVLNTSEFYVAALNA